MAEVGSNLLIVFKNDVVRLNGNGSDVDGDLGIVDYLWEQVTGPPVVFETEISDAFFTAPGFEFDQVLDFVLTVVDDDSGTGSDVVRVIVRGNRPPSLTAFLEQPSYEKNEAVNLTADAFDPDGDPISDFTVVQLGGAPVNLSTTTSEDGSSLTLAFTAPGVAAGGENLVFRFTAGDGSTAGSRDVQIPIQGDNPPVVTILQGQTTFGKNELVTISVSGSDPDGDAVELSVEQTEGPPVQFTTTPSEDSTSLGLSFTAPGFAQDTNLAFRFTGTGGEASAFEDARVTILKNNPPEIEVPLEIAFDAGTVAVLEVSITDADQDDVSYSWTQVDGTTVDLSDIGSPNPSFLAPQVDEDKTLRLSVSVNDGNDLVEATLDILIRPSPVTSPFILSTDAPSLSEAQVMLALVNTSQEIDEVATEARDTSGLDRTGQIIDIPPFFPGEQRLFSAEELLVEGADVQDVESVTVRGVQSPLEGLFIIGDPLGRRLDIVGDLESSETLYVPLHAGAGTATTTLLYVWNPNPSIGVTLDIEMWDEQGSLIGEEFRSLEASGTLRATLDELFDAPPPTGSVRVSSSQAVRGFAIISEDRSLASIVAQAASPTDQLYAPVFFLDGRGADSTLTLFNTESFTVQASIEAFDNQGISLGLAEVDLDPRVLNVFDLKDLFGFKVGQNRAGTHLGYLSIGLSTSDEEVTIAQFGVTGILTFSDRDGEARTIMQLVTGGSQQTILPHVNLDPEARLYTGMAIVNVGGATSAVTMELFAASGEKKTEVAFDVAPGHRRIDTLNGELFFGKTFVQVGGHVRISSDQPVLVWGLYGQNDSEFLANVSALKAVFAVPAEETTEPIP